jgi:HEPN pEK499 p136
MGNFRKLEIDFIRRTLSLVEQYDEWKDAYEFDEQYNHTLLINCLLGLAILPKEKIVNYAPKEKLPILKTLEEAGIKNSRFHPNLKDSKDLLDEIRDSVAHFNIKFVSDNDAFLIDRIQFINDRMDDGVGVVVADFATDELRNFVEWLAKELISNYEQYAS